MSRKQVLWWKQFCSMKLHNKQHHLYSLTCVSKKNRQWTIQTFTVRRKCSPDKKLLLIIILIERKWKYKKLKKHYLNEQSPYNVKIFLKFDDAISKPPHRSTNENAYSGLYIIPHTTRKYTHLFVELSMHHLGNPILG